MGSTYKAEILLSMKDAASAVANKAGGAIGSMTNAAVTYGKYGAVALAGGAIMATKSFADFEGQMNEVFTLMPDITKEAMGTMTDEVKNFSKEFGTLPNEVVPALYQAISAGVPADNVFAFLETAQKAAIGGNTELITAVNGISSVVNAYGADAMSAGKASDIMFTAMRMGKTTIGELSGALFNVVPTAVGAGVSFENIAAGLAAMAIQGTPTSVATTSLRQALVELSQDGSDVSDVFKEITGKAFKEFMVGGGNLSQAFTKLGDHAKKSGLGVNDLFGSVEAGSAVLQLTGKGAEFLNKNLAEMTNSAGATDKAYEKMEGGLGRAFAKIRAYLKVTLDDVGEKLGPSAEAAADAFLEYMPKIQAFFSDLGKAVSELLVYLTPVFDWIKANVFPVLEQMASVVRDNLKPVLIALGVVLAAVILPILASMAASAAPFIVAGLAIAAVAKVISDNWGQISAFLLPLLDDMKAFFMEVFGEIITFIVDNWPQIQATIQTVLYLIKSAFDYIWPVISVVVTTTWKVIKHVIRAALDIIMGIIKIVMGIITGDWRTAWEGLKQVLKGVVGGILSVVGTVITGIKDVGVNIIKGLWKGIDSMYAWFKKKFIDFLKKILPNVVEKALGIKSPSKLMYGYGVNVAKGLALGITGASWLVEGAVGSMLSPMTSGPIMATSMAGIGSGGSAGGNTKNTYNIEYHGPGGRQGAQEFMTEFQKLTSDANLRGRFNG